jgi:alpha-tubulin suppressor-like RCC1 family protein
VNPLLPENMPGDEGRQPQPPLGSELLKDIVAGASHTCVLLVDGRVRCWGTSAILGYGDLAASDIGFNVGDDEIPTAVGFVDIGEPVEQLSAGYQHTCALLARGAVRCWGAGNQGALGYGNRDRIGDDESPASKGDVALDGLEGPVLQVAAGANYTCVLIEGGSVRCWGRGYIPAAAISLSDGTFDRYDDSLPVSGEGVPSGPIDVGGEVIQLAAGASHTCALLKGGAVRCWGSGANGRLGYEDDSDVGDDESPASVGDVAVGGTVRQVAAGASQTCAVLDSGALRCWGYGFDGRLGYGNRENIGDDETPASAGDVPVGGAVRSVLLQGSLTCALLETGDVRCWGPGAGLHIDPTPIVDRRSFSPDAGSSDEDSNVGGQIVCRTVDLYVSHCPGYVGALGYARVGNIGDHETPSTAGDLQLGGPVRRLAVGGDHACVILEGGGARCWGAGYYGTLGLGNDRDVGDDEVPASVPFVDAAGPPLDSVPRVTVDQVQQRSDNNAAQLEPENLARSVGGSLRTELAQVVVPGVAGQLTEARFAVSCPLGEDATVHVEGVLPDGTPDGIAVASKRFQIDPSGALLSEAVFDFPPSLPAGAPFALVLRSTGSSCAAETADGDVYTGAYFYRNLATSVDWVRYPEDLVFQTFVLH